MIYNTKCEKCIFKIINEDKQTGCSFNIDKILENNYPGLYSSDNIDKNNSSWIIRDFKCPYARTYEWLDIVTEHHKIDYSVQLNKELKNSIYMTVLLDNQDDDIINILDDICNSEIAPVYVSFVLSVHSCYRSAECIKLIQSYNMPCEWKLHSTLDPEATISEMVDLALCTNLDQTMASIILIKYANTIYNKDLLKRSNDILNQCNSKQVVLITNDFLDGLTVPSSLYRSMDKQIGLVYHYVNNDESVYRIKIL